MLTSHPGHIERCKTLPPIGNSDHDIVLVDISANVNKPKPTKRKIYLWKKADMTVNLILSIRQILMTLTTSGH